MMDLRTAIHFVRQECPQSCGIAVVAMVSGKTFAEVRELAPSPSVSAPEMDRLLTACGVQFERQLHPTIEPHSTYIVTVASLNNRGGMHYIVMQTGDACGYDEVTVSVLDPVMEGKQSYMDGGLVAWAEAVKIKEPSNG